MGARAPDGRCHDHPRYGGRARDAHRGQSLYVEFWIYRLLHIFTLLPGPGSCLFLFEGRQTVNAGDSAYKSSFVGSERVFRYLHCGDFRASPQHVMHPAVHGKRIDHVYLDTTYLDPKVRA
jgi:hypothetical protein